MCMSLLSVISGIFNGAAAAFFGSYKTQNKAIVELKEPLEMEIARLKNRYIDIPSVADDKRNLKSDLDNVRKDSKKAYNLAIEAH